MGMVRPRRISRADDIAPTSTLHNSQSILPKHGKQKAFRFDSLEESMIRYCSTRPGKFAGALVSCLLLLPAVVNAQNIFVDLRTDTAAPNTAVINPPAGYSYS